MSIILWITLLCYLCAAIIFNLAMIRCYQDDQVNWTGNKTSDLAGMFVASMVWPFILIVGMFKLSKEKEND